MVAAPVASQLVEPGNGLRVVIEHVRPGSDDRVEGPRLPLEIRNQRLDPTVGREPANGADRRSPVSGTTIGQIVAIDRGDHHVIEPEPDHHVADALGLLADLPGRLAVRDGTLATLPRADLA